MKTDMLRYAATTVAYVDDYGTPCRVDMGNVGGVASREVEMAADDFRNFSLEWLGVETHNVDVSLSPDHLLNQWGADLEPLYGRERGDRRLLPSIPINDLNTSWNEQTIWAYTHLAPFEVRVSCEGSGSSIEVFCLTEEMGRVWDRLVALNLELHSLNTEDETALALAHNAVDEARDAVAQNAEELADLLVPADPLLNGSREKELALAETTLAEVKALIANLLERRDLGLALEFPAVAPDTGRVSTRPSWTMRVSPFCQGRMRPAPGSASV